MPPKQINRRTGGFNTPPKFRLRRGIIRNYQPKITKAIKFTKLIMKLVGHMIKSCEDPRISLLVWSIKPMNWESFIHVCSINIITYLIMQTAQKKDMKLIRILQNRRTELNMNVYHGNYPNVYHQEKSVSKKTVGKWLTIPVNYPRWR